MRRAYPRSRRSSSGRCTWRSWRPWAFWAWGCSERSGANTRTDVLTATLRIQPRKRNTRENRQTTRTLTEAKQAKGHASTGSTGDSSPSWWPSASIWLHRTKIWWPARAIPPAWILLPERLLSCSFSSWLDARQDGGSSLFAYCRWRMRLRAPIYRASWPTVATVSSGWSNTSFCRQRAFGVCRSVSRRTSSTCSFFLARCSKWRAVAPC